VTSVTFDVAAADRLAGKAGVAATFSFVTTAGGALVANSKIALSYPDNLFALTGTPGIQMSGSGGTASVSAQTSTRIIIATSAVIAASTAVTVTVTGLTMFSSSSGGLDLGTVSVSTDVDLIPFSCE